MAVRYWLLYWGKQLGVHTGVQPSIVLLLLFFPSWSQFFLLFPKFHYQNPFHYLHDLTTCTQLHYMHYH